MSEIKQVSEHQFCIDIYCAWLFDKDCSKPGECRALIAAKQNGWIAEPKEKTVQQIKDELLDFIKNL